MLTQNGGDRGIHTEIYIKKVTKNWTLYGKNSLLGEKGCWHSIPSPPDDFLPIPVLYNMHSTSENYTNINLIFNRYRYIYKLKIIFTKKKYTYRTY